MPEDRTFDPSCNCSSCTRERVKRGGMEREWPLILFGCLLAALLFIALTVASCRTFGFLGILPLPAGLFSIIWTALRLTRAMRYARRVREIVLGTSFVAVGICWVALSIKAGEESYPHIRTYFQQLYERDLQKDAPGWLRLLFPAPSSPPSGIEAEVCSLLVTLLSIASPFLTYFVLLAPITGGGGKQRRKE